MSALLKNRNWLAKPFYNGQSVLTYLRDRQENLANFDVLDFKRGVKLILDSDMRLTSGPKFDHRRDVDTIR